MYSSSLPLWWLVEEESEQTLISVEVVSFHSEATKAAAAATIGAENEVPWEQAASQEPETALVDSLHMGLPGAQISTHVP